MEQGGGRSGAWFGRVGRRASGKDIKKKTPAIRNSGWAKALVKGCFGLVGGVEIFRKTII